MTNDSVKLGYKEKFYPESKFGGFTDIDGTISFYVRVNSLLESSFIVLDVGCGRGAYDEDSVSVRRSLRILRGKVKKVVGIDVDKNAGENPFIDEFQLISGNRWPLNDDCINLIVCDSVLEHVENPDLFFWEARRVLIHGGYLCIRTANSWSYIGILSKLIPNRYHAKITRIVQDGRKEADVFSTVYKCNSILKLKAMMDRYGFESVVYGYEAEPSYLSFSKIAYWLGVLHQKIAPSSIRATIFAFGKLSKNSGQHGPPR